MARRKLSKQSEFKPDPRQNSLSGLFHVTQLQKQRMLKWTLYVLTGILLLTIQDVIMSRVSIFGATTDLPVVYILLITVIEGVDVGSLFVLFASTIYYFAGALLHWPIMRRRDHRYAAAAGLPAAHESFHRHLRRYRADNLRDGSVRRGHRPWADTVGPGVLLPDHRRLQLRRYGPAVPAYQ